MAARSARQIHRRCVLLRGNRAQHETGSELRARDVGTQQPPDFHRRFTRTQRRDQHFQITTDGFAPVRRSHRRYAGRSGELRATHQGLRQERRRPKRRYSPAEVVDTEVVPVFGNPDPARICTSIVERQNLTIRMQMRRLTRLTNAFSKEVGEPVGRILPALRLLQLLPIHRSLRVTPAMEAGITDHIWEISELLV